MKEYILNKHIRFRQEDGYILICDCKRLLDYEVPSTYLELMRSLQRGFTLNKERDEIIKDFYNLGIIEIKGKERPDINEDVLSKISYDENEFF